MHLHMHLCTYTHKLTHVHASTHAISYICNFIKLPFSGELTTSSLLFFIMHNKHFYICTYMYTHTYTQTYMHVRINLLL